jgi:hypothetical protein
MRRRRPARRPICWPRSARARRLADRARIEANFEIGTAARFQDVWRAVDAEARAGKRTA